VSYEQYQSLGGIINKNDYRTVLNRARDEMMLDKTVISQAENIAKQAGIALHNTKEAIDPRIMLYGILRIDARPSGIEHHHSQMGDQRLFAEALRMSGDNDSLEKLIKAYPSVPF
ncbi:MAG TPA: hypothetical protein VNG29_03480, partial [Candidatus Paceibacterota bacterium]|nr:hypothetical protein [Candidatus Paceibacterota bacterium]